MKEEWVSLFCGYPTLCMSSMSHSSGNCTSIWALSQCILGLSFWCYLQKEPHHISWWNSVYVFCAGKNIWKLFWLSILFVVVVFFLLILLLSALITGKSFVGEIWSSSFMYIFASDVIPGVLAKCRTNFLTLPVFLSGCEQGVLFDISLV